MRPMQVLSSMTQSAMLHMRGQRVSAARVSRVLQMLQVNEGGFGFFIMVSYYLISVPWALQVSNGGCCEQIQGKKL